MKEEPSSSHIKKDLSSNGLSLKKLTAEQIVQIDDLVASLGEFGEVHLVIQHGQLKYINKMESYKARNLGDGAGS